MDESLHNHDLLVRYIDGDLPPQEKAALEERLRTDGSLQEQLTLLRAAVQALKQFGTSQKVQSIHSEMMKELKGGQKAKVISFNKGMRYVLAVAASVVVLFIGVKLYTASQLSPEKLYDQSFVDFNVSTSRGSNENLSTVETHYQQKAYDAVISDLRSTNLSAKDSLLVGLAYLHQNRPAQAIGFFNHLAYSANDFQQDAEFYLSLSYLKNKEYNKALPLMEKISANASHLYHGQLTDETIEKVKKLNKQ